MSEASGGLQRSSGGQRLPAPGDVREPRSQAEAVRMLELSQKLMQVGCQYLEPSLSIEVRKICAIVIKYGSIAIHFFKLNIRRRLC